MYRFFFQIKGKMQDLQIINRVTSLCISAFQPTCKLYLCDFLWAFSPFCKKWHAHSVCERNDSFCATLYDFACVNVQGPQVNKLIYKPRDGVVAISFLYWSVFARKAKRMYVCVRFSQTLCCYYQCYVSVSTGSAKRRRCVCVRFTQKFCCSHRFSSSECLR